MVIKMYLNLTLKSAALSVTLSDSKLSNSIWCHNMSLYVLKYFLSTISKHRPETFHSQVTKTDGSYH